VARKTISPRNIKLGMYVHGFEGSWFSHPFWRAGFEIEDEATLEKIRESAVEGVIIEWIPVSDEPPSPPRPAPARSPDAAAAMMRRAVQTIVPRPEPHDKAEPIEIQQAKAVMSRARSVVISVFDQARLGRAIRASDVAAVVDDVSEAVLRNPSAMIKVARLKSKNEYTYMHSVAVCTLMVNFARTLNLPESRYRPLGLAGLLHDVGKLSIDDDILEKAGSLTAAEFDEIKMHTVRGRDMLADSTDVPETALDVVLHHHERMNGTGYPFGLTADQISLDARMGAICDIYDALTSNRPYKKGWAPQDALTAMEGWEGHLDPDLLFQFMRSIGMFLPGTLVELRSRRLGIILPQSPRAPMPKARAFFCMRARDFIDPIDVGLGENLNHDQPLRKADPARFGFTEWETMKTVILTGSDPRPIADRAA
jgi:HD-GYP domain-containing protein (c-di-GMP phosphodiesterase class II)